MASQQKVETYKKISTRFKRYKQEMNTVWESFEVINFYADILHDGIKQGNIPVPNIRSLSINSTKVRKTIVKQRAYGSISHIKDKKNPRSALIESILIFENYISDLIMLVYTDYPQKALSLDSPNENQVKLMGIIFSSQDKPEIINRLLEEKIRNVFYGNIADIFQKDLAKLELRNTFTSGTGPKLIDNLCEILARRNIYIHNNGRVDRKYIRETKKTDIKLGSVLKIDSNYIRETINVLSQIATDTTVSVLKNIYKVKPKSIALLKEYWHE